MVKQYGNIFRFHRKKSALSQAQLAEYAGVGKTVIFDIEHNKPTVKLDTLLKVAEILNIDICFKSPLMDEYWEKQSEKG